MLFGGGNGGKGLFRCLFRRARGPRVGDHGSPRGCCLRCSPSCRGSTLVIIHNPACCKSRQAAGEKELSKHETGGILHAERKPPGSLDCRSTAKRHPRQDMNHPCPRVHHHHHHPLHLLLLLHVSCPCLRHDMASCSSPESFDLPEKSPETVVHVHGLQVTVTALADRRG